MATKPAEAKHGADWEWWLVRNGRGLGFRVQAKRLFTNGHYSSLLKNGANPYEQLDKLVAASSQAGCEPLYCFYNFDHPSATFVVPNHCRHGYRGPGYWGCSLASPQHVRAVQSAALNDLKTGMIPWHMLVCGNDRKKDLFESARDSLGRLGRDKEKLAERELPDRVRRLIELADERREGAAPYTTYLDASYWDTSGLSEVGPDGIVVFRDQRGP